MNPRALFIRMGKIFPNPITMEDIRRMKRRDLTPEEKNKPYAKYFYKELADIPVSDLQKVNSGPIDPERATAIQNRNDLMKSGYLDVETGYTVMPDGSGFAATLVAMPGVTPTMLDWWFNWHPLESLRYALWCPVAHTGIGVMNPSRHRDSSGIALKERNYGSAHYPVEGFNVQGADKLRIEFFSPADFGLDMNLFTEPGISRAYCANVIIDALNVPFNAFFHAVRIVKGGIEYRSRYWIGQTMKAGGPVRVKSPLPFKMIDLARNNCLHSLTEYNNLASFLPQLYQEMGGRI
ncbi:MAG: hypothetical protein Q8M56_00990 [Desulfobacterales bacterium]|nr:hypothetical protein [Desulfobacterales bacterium]